MSIVLTSFEVGAPYEVKVSTRYSPAKGQLEVEWQLSGPLPKLGLEVDRLGQRADKLWLDTVFEVFGRFGNSHAYWETNLSPSGAWNAYHFEGYRVGMRQTDDVRVDAFRWQVREAQRWHFSAEYRIKPEPLPLHLGFASIFYPGPFHYAVQHTEAKPDFHAPASFAVMLSSLTP